MATGRRTRNEATEESKGEKGLEKKGKKIDSGEAMEQYQTIMEETEDEAEMLNSDQDRQEQPRWSVVQDERHPKDKSQEETKYGERRGRGRGEEGDLGDTSGVKGPGGRVNYVTRGRARRGRGRSSRGRGRSEGKRERSESILVRRYRKTLKRIQYAERAYSENTDEDIRRIIQQMEEEATQGRSESEMEDWEYLLPDPGNTRGRMTLYKQALHVYWVMKRLLAKAMEQVAMEMAELAQGIPNLKKKCKTFR